MLKPTMYYKDITSINYQKLKNNGIKCLIFDLDNTLALLDEKTPSDKLIKLVESLKNDFAVFIITNSPKKRALLYSQMLNIEIISFALKPSIRALNKIRKKYSYKKCEMIMIGDQFITDILSGVRFGIKTILVDPLSEKDLKITKINRIIENNLINRYKRKNVFERGKYYE